MDDINIGSSLQVPLVPLDMVDLHQINDLYRRVIKRNNRLKDFYSDIIVRNERITESVALDVEGKKELEKNFFG